VSTHVPCIFNARGDSACMPTRSPCILNALFLHREGNVCPSLCPQVLSSTILNEFGLNFVLEDYTNGWSFIQGQSHGTWNPIQNVLTSTK
jgi:hypothetical protein